MNQRGRATRNIRLHWKRVRSRKPPHVPHAICKAFDAANWARLQALEALITPDPDSDDTPRKRPSWSQFFASFASDKESSEAVLRNRSLVALLATTQLTASAHRDAMADAKARSAPDGG